MNPKNLTIRMDRETGDFWLVEERYVPGKPRSIRKIANMTGPFLLAFCADLHEIEGTEEVIREAKFPDGTLCMIKATLIRPEDDPTPDAPTYFLPPKLGEVPVEDQRVPKEIIDHVGSNPKRVEQLGKSKVADFRIKPTS